MVAVRGGNPDSNPDSSPEAPGASESREGGHEVEDLDLDLDLMHSGLDNPPLDSVPVPLWAAQRSGAAAEGASALLAWSLPSAAAPPLGQEPLPAPPPPPLAWQPQPLGGGGGAVATTSAATRRTTRTETVEETAREVLFLIVASVPPASGPAVPRGADCEARPRR